MTNFGSFNNWETVNTLARESTALRSERASHMKAKSEKATAENNVLRSILDNVLPALPSISSKLEGKRPNYTPGITRAVDLGGGLYLSESAEFFDIVEGDVLKQRHIPLAQVLDRTSLGAILAVLLTSVRAQAGTMTPRTAQIDREAGILEGIAAAFKAGGVR